MPKIPESLFLAILSLMCSFGPSVAAGEQDAVLLVAGDITGCAPEELQRSAATAKILAREIDSARQSHLDVKVAILGDIAYDEGSEEQFACFQKTWGRVLTDKLPDVRKDVLPVMGNHDFKTGNGEWFYKTFADTDAVMGGSDGLSQTALGDWQIFALNSEIESAVGSEQYTWFEKSLAGAAQNCALALWHRPVFSSGKHGHGDNGDLIGAEPVKSETMADMEALFYARGGSLVLNGHDHDYEELAPHDSDGKPAADGIRSFVVGTGGKQLYDPYAKTWPAISRNYDAQTYGVLKLTLHTGRYEWSFLPIGADAKPKYSGESACNTRK